MRCDGTVRCDSIQQKREQCRDNTIRLILVERLGVCVGYRFWKMVGLHLNTLPDSPGQTGQSNSSPEMAASEIFLIWCRCMLYKRLLSSNFDVVAVSSLPSARIISFDIVDDFFSNVNTGRLLSNIFQFFLYV